MSENNSSSWHKRPLTLDDIPGQDLVIDFLKHYVKKNHIPVGLLASGSEGSGKTSTISAFLRTVLCLQRPPGATTPCLECNSCKALDDPRNNQHENVVWVELHEQDNHDSLASKVNKALSDFELKLPIQLSETQMLLKELEQEDIQKNPNHPKAPHRNYKFIVIDQTEHLPDDLLQCFLFPLEQRKHIETFNLRMIFIATNLDKIEWDTRGRFIGRVVRLPFRPPSLDELLAVARKLAPQTPEDVLRLICKHVDRFGGGYRKLVNYLDDFSQPSCNFDPDFIKTSLVVPRLEEELDTFWKLCALCTPGSSSAFLDLWKHYNYLLSISKGDRQLLHRVLNDSLLAILGKPGAQKIHLQAYQDFTSAYQRYPLELALGVLYGLPYVSLSGLEINEE